MHLELDLPRFRPLASLLPKFARVRGTVSRLDWNGETWVGDRWWGDLLLDDVLVHGRWHARSGDFVFEPEHATDVERVLGHAEWEVLDGYWGERAALVLDRTRTWTHAAFRPRDAVRTGSILRPGGPPLPGEGEIVPDGWDHEHCGMCWETIGAGGIPTGWVSRADT